MLYFIFPNLVLLAQQDHILLSQVLPKTPKESVIDIMMLVPKDISAQNINRWSKMFEASLKVLDEDIQMGESIQLGIDSGVHQENFYYESLESGLTHFHSLVRQSLI